MPSLPRSEGPVEVHTVTTASLPRGEDTGYRLKQYLVTMAIRTACFLLAVVLEGWPRWVAAFFAIVLPWIAVVVANAVRPRIPGEVTPVTDLAHQLPPATPSSAPELR